MKGFRNIFVSVLVALIFFAGAMFAGCGPVAEEQKEETPKTYTAYVENLETDYTVGDNFSVVGKTLVLTEQGSTNSISVQITEDMISQLPDLTSKGTKQLKISYNGATYTINITVNEDEELLIYQAILKLIESMQDVSINKVSGSIESTYFAKVLQDETNYSFEKESFELSDDKISNLRLTNNEKEFVKILYLEIVKSIVQASVTSVANGDFNYNNKSVTLSPELALSYFLMNIQDVDDISKLTFDVIFDATPEQLANTIVDNINYYFGIKNNATQNALKVIIKNFLTELRSDITLSEVDVVGTMENILSILSNPNKIIRYEYFTVVNELFQNAKEDNFQRFLSSVVAEFLNSDLEIRCYAENLTVGQLSGMRKSYNNAIISLCESFEDLIFGNKETFTALESFSEKIDNLLAQHNALFEKEVYYVVDNFMNYNNIYNLRSFEILNTEIKIVVKIYNVVSNSIAEDPETFSEFIDNALSYIDDNHFDDEINSYIRIVFATLKTFAGEFDCDFDRFVFALNDESIGSYLHYLPFVIFGFIEDNSLQNAVVSEFNECLAAISENESLKDFALLENVFEIFLPYSESEEEIITHARQYLVDVDDMIESGDFSNLEEKTVAIMDEVKDVTDDLGMQPVILDYLNFVANTISENGFDAEVFVDSVLNYEAFDNIKNNLMNYGIIGNLFFEKLFDSLIGMDGKLHISNFNYEKILPIIRESLEETNIEELDINIMLSLFEYLDQIPVMTIEEALECFARDSLIAFAKEYKDEIVEQIACAIVAYSGNESLSLGYDGFYVALEEAIEIVSEIFDEFTDGNFNAQNSILNLKNFIDKYYSTDSKTSVYALTTLVAFLSGEEIDFNEVLGDIQLPDGVEVDFNKLIDRLTDELTWTDIIKVKTFKTELITENNEYVGENITLEIDINFDIEIIKFIENIKINLKLEK